MSKSCKRYYGSSDSVFLVSVACTVPTIAKSNMYLVLWGAKQILQSFDYAYKTSIINHPSTQALITTGASPCHVHIFSKKHKHADRKKSKNLSSRVCGIKILQRNTQKAYAGFVLEHERNVVTNSPRTIVQFSAFSSNHYRNAAGGRETNVIIHYCS